MAYFIKTLLWPLVSYLGDKLIAGGSALVKFFYEYQKRKEMYEENLKQSQLVDSIAEEIKKLEAEGKPVPEELKKRLVYESSKINIGERFP